MFDHALRKTAAFDSKGISNIALIAMIKDEDYIIYENLVWHFCLCFRKFIIVDNNSTDQTRFLLEKFKKETKYYANVFIIGDPIVAHIQSRVITGAYLLAGSIWDDLEWVFPVDADKFWLPEVNLKTLLANIPTDVSVIETAPSQYRPSKDYSSLLDQPFYKRLHYKVKAIEKKKIALRARSGLIISQGNHSANFPYRKNWWRKLTFTDRPYYISGNLIGLHMPEFYMRSTEQVHKKLSNDMKANLIAQEKKLIAPDAGLHWDSYKQDLELYGSGAALKRFNELIISPNDALDDPLPIDKSLELFKLILAKEEVEM